MEPTPAKERQQLAFRKRLEELLNSCSMENGSNTPDFILATYMAESLAAFDKAAIRRDEWYGRQVNLIGDVPPPTPGVVMSGPAK